MKGFMCQENGCGKIYTNPYNLKRHQVIKHLRTKCFKCSLCFKELSSMQNLREHEFMHRGEKPYHCDVCDAKYRYCSQLSNHKRLHLRLKQSSNFIELKLTDLLKTVEVNGEFMIRPEEECDEFYGCEFR